MLTTNILDALQSIKFGYGFAGHNRTMKVRFKAETAKRVLSLIPKHFHKHILFHLSKKGYGFVGVVEHRDSAIWPAIESAIITAKADSLRQTADQLEYGTPIQLNLGV
jgi:hypothetical protein